MLPAIRKDWKKRKLNRAYETSRKTLKFILDYKYFFYVDRLRFGFYLTEIPRNSSRVRIKNLCLFTGRARGVVTAFKMSRNFFKRYALSGFFKGITKYSW